MQDRLPKELALAGITTVEAANRWLAETYIPRHNAAFVAVAAEQDGSAFLPDRSAAWAEILCIQEERTVGNDNTVKWNRLCLQLPPSRLRPHFVKAAVRVHEYPDGAIAVFSGPIAWPTTMPPDTSSPSSRKPRDTLPRRQIFSSGGHAPRRKNKNGADRSRATKTGQVDELATGPEAYRLTSFGGDDCPMTILTAGGAAS